MIDCKSIESQISAIMKKLLIVFTVVFTLPQLTSAQYFGQNKPRYQSFDFKVLETPNYDLHYYLKNQAMVDRIAQMTEQWHMLHQQITQDTFINPNPIIFYNNHAEFQQTNAISGSIGVGTGGVTEGLKNRVVMPLTFSNQQTSQVLGHELVHAFQFHMIIGGDSTSIKNLVNLPLYIVEGMAEYMSLGRYDAFTAMWMRDAIINDDLPEIKKLSNPKYFPYRYGQAFWSFLTGYYGDDIIEPLFTETAKYGLKIACERVLNTDIEELSKRWKSSMEAYYAPFLGDKKENFIGKKLLSDENSGRINVSPSISPNGKYVVFLSEKDLFSTDLFLADAQSGKILNKIASLVKDGDLDALNALESSGTWSPDSKKFAFIAFKKGKNVLVVKEALSGKTLETIEIPKVPAIANPAWSPDGKTIIVSGLVEGQTDLYAYELKSKRVKQLTDDIYSEIQPNFSDDGTRLVFSTDKRSFSQGRTHGKYTWDLAVMNMENQTSSIINVFPKANNLNPNFDHEGNIYFVSDRDGFTNMYRYIAASGEVKQMTELLTGISGISRLSPAIAASTKRDRVLFTHYFDHKYTIYQSTSERLLSKSVEPDDVREAAGTLPVVGLNKIDVVNHNLDIIDNLALVSPNEFKNVKYASKFKLDYLGGGAGVGVGNDLFGNNLAAAGSLDLLFSDMLGNNQIFTSLRVNGEIYDFGGQAFWLNRKGRIAYGAGFGHLPNTFGGYGQARYETINIGGQPRQVIAQELELVRIYEDQASGFFHYPISTKLRIEGGLGAGVKYFRKDIITNYYDSFSGFYLGQEREKQEIGDILNVGNYYFIKKGFSYAANIGLVGDNSYFGLTSPLNGHRYRLNFSRSLGADNYYSITADYRKYMWMKPFSLAFRGMGLIRYDQSELNTSIPNYLGQMGMIHGFDFFFNDPFNTTSNQLNPDILLGQKALVGNVEVRIPFTGPKQLALIGSNAFFSDIVLFYDAGVAFENFSEAFDDNLAPLIMRAGGGLRINLFGALILEPYYAFAIKGGTGGTFGLNIVPGW